MARGTARRLNRAHLVLDSESEDDNRRSERGSAPPVHSIVLSDDDDDYDLPQPRVLFPQRSPGARHAVRELLRNRGVTPRDQWLETCLNGLALSHPGFAGLPTHRQAELCFGQFLMADLNIAGAGCLPPSIHALHCTELPGPFVIQVDEVAEIGHSLRDRYQEKPAGLGRTLKLSMTDGVQRVSGIEYRPIRALQVFSPAGMKISLRYVCVRRGLLMLVPEIVEILGGCVEDLESSRLRAVQVINRPPRGRWTREGTTEPSLVERATSAAWQAGAPERSSIPIDNDGQPHQRAPPSASGSGLSEGRAMSVDGQQVAEHTHLGQHRRAQPNVPLAQVTRDEHTVRMASAQRDDTQQPGLQNQFRNPNRQSFGHPIVNSSRLDGVLQAAQAVQYESPRQAGAGSIRESIGASSASSAPVRHMEQTGDHSTIQQVVRDETSGEAATLPPSSAHVSNGQFRPVPTFGRLSLQPRQRVQSKLPVESPRQPPQAAEQPLRPADGVQVIDLDDHQESYEHPVGSCTPPPRPVTFGDENPFVYLAVLKERATFCKGNDVVRGRIKCIISGVINFRYKDTDEFILSIYIEDGSFITAAFVQHQLLQRLIGFSPKEVTAGLDNPDKKRDMTDNMRRFQKILEKFEGYMDVEVPNSSSAVTITKMTKGVQPPDVEALHDRVQQSVFRHARDIPTIDLTTP